MPVVGIISVLYYESWNSNSKLRIINSNSRTIMMVVTMIIKMLVMMMINSILAYSRFVWNRTKSIKVIITIATIITTITITESTLIILPTIVHYPLSCNRIRNMRRDLMETHSKTTTEIIKIMIVVTVML